MTDPILMLQPPQRGDLIHEPGCPWANAITPPSGRHYGLMERSDTLPDAKHCTRKGCLT